MNSLWRSRPLPLSLGLLAFALLAGIVMSRVAQATLWLNVSIIYKKQIDKDLVLVNELHSKEIIQNRDGIFLQMKNGLQFFITGHFEGDPDRYGPSSKVGIGGRIFDKEGNLLKDFRQKKNITELSSQAVLKYKHNDQFIDITVTPELL